MQSVTITTTVVSSNPAHGEVYSIQHYAMITFVSDLWQVGGFKSRRGKNKNLTAQKYNSNTVWFNFQTYIFIYNQLFLLGLIFVFVYYTVKTKLSMYIAHTVPGRYTLYPQSLVLYLEEEELNITDEMHLISNDDP